MYTVIDSLVLTVVNSSLKSPNCKTNNSIRLLILNIDTEEVTQTESAQ